MKIKGGYTYRAKLNKEELEIIKTALELLLDSYNGLDMPFDYYKGRHEHKDIEKLNNQVEEFNADSST